MQLKEKVFFLIKNDTNSFISGQTIADKLNISISKVKEIVNLIKEDGYIINYSEKGYRIKNENRVLSEEIRKNLQKDLHGIEINCFKEIDSTNDEAKKNGKNHFSIFVAPKQSDGKGRCGRKFESPGGLYFSIFLKKDELVFADILTIRAVVAVVRVLKNIGLEVGVKWVNDVFIDNKKVCGILTESLINMYGDITDIVVGIGINIGTDQSKFSKEVRSVAGVIGDGIDKNLIVAKILNELSDIFKIERGIIIDEYKSYLIVLNKKIYYSIDGSIKEGLALDIDENGSLVILENEKIRKLSYGDVSIKL
ncbi:biotin--[acetyl-CoA-carboxylase] ligase [Anaerococcus sp. AGMB00486]|uniref:biotin--[biotin carboxyl-carrier protein] ligase n=2 Tax=Anaerococcus TaxID=165779 RepID=A0ABX2N9Q7_9FIRM|nr:MULTISPECIES: biotin--[acetyl-CoA-carboxylase] ligase [Anaerococcus]MSS78336.1 biotin--[acetyl-CoA-carboxylase] ligase [Anaerococcus porci]NVF11450.1 biotin--[acetyl-CoA-carboxylase] ligase [Anaerococcus faecalis]